MPVANSRQRPCPFKGCQDVKRFNVWRCEAFSPLALVKYLASLCVLMSLAFDMLVHVCVLLTSAMNAA